MGSSVAGREEGEKITPDIELEDPGCMDIFQGFEQDLWHGEKYRWRISVRVCNFVFKIKGHLFLCMCMCYGL